MRYEVPECRIVELNAADVIATSNNIYVPGGPEGDTPLATVNENSDYGTGSES